MESIKKEIKEESALLEKFGADERFNLQESYSKQASFFGEGKYPPDWARRRETVWWLQDNRCGRCGKRQENEGHVHHIKPLSDGGNNILENLVGLCSDCHALMHPAVDELSGHWKKAPKYPAKNAVSKVAVIRRGPNGKFEEKLQTDHDFEKLTEETEVKENYFAACSPAVYNTGPVVARQFNTEQEQQPIERQKQAIQKLNKLLLYRGRVPENGSYNNRRLIIETPAKGILGWLSPYEPEVTVEAERPAESGSSYNAITEEVDRNGSAGTEFVFSQDVTDATVKVTDGEGKVTQKNVSFSDENNKQSVSVPVSPPELTATTFGSYLWSAGQKTYILPLLYLLLWLAVVPVTGLVLVFAILAGMAGTVGTAGWFIIALLFGGAWTKVGELALATFISFIIGGFAIAILEQFGIDVGE